MKKLLILLSIILLSTYTLPILFNQSILLYYGDSFETMYPYFIHLTNQIRSGFLVFWNYSMGFGTNNFVNFFNGLGSPFVYIASLFPEDAIKYLFLYFDIIRFYLIAFFAYLWSKKMYKSENSRIVFSLLITFSGWVMHFIHFGFYLDGYMYLPLIMYLSDEVLENKKTWLFSIVIALTAFISPYFLYMHSIYLLLYQIFRYFAKNIPGKNLFFEFFKIFKFYILGVLLAAFVILPELSIVLSSPRVGFNLIDNLYINLNPQRLYNFLTSFFSPVLNDYNPNIFISRYLVLDKSIFYNFTSIFSLIALINLIFVKFKEKKAYFILLSLLLIISFIPATNFLMNGNDNVRWFFMILITIIMGVAFFIENYSYNKLSIFISMFVLFLIVLFIFVSKKYQLVDNEFLPYDQYYYIFLILFTLFYSYFIINNKTKYIVLLLTFEIVLLLFFRMYLGNNQRFISEQEFKKLNSNNNSEVFNYLNEIDQSFYRIDVSGAFGNDAILNDYKGFTFYSSLYNHEIRELLDERFTSNWNMGYVQSKFLVKHLSGSKYLVNNSMDDFVPFGFELLKNINDKFIYIQKTPVNLGFAYTQSFSKQSLDNTDKSIQDFWMFQSAITEELIQNNKIDTLMFPDLIYENFVNDYIDLNQFDNGYLIVDYSKTNPYASCKLDYYKNGNIIDSDLISEYGYTYLMINNDYDGFYLYCSSIYNENEFIPANIYYAKDKLIEALYRNLSEFDKFSNVEINENIINSNILITNDNSYVITTIAYDKGWRIYVNDTEVKGIKTNYGFIGFKLDAGLYKVRMEYTPPLFITGVVISIVSFIIFIGLLVFKRGKYSGKK